MWFVVIVVVLRERTALLNRASRWMRMWRDCLAGKHVVKLGDRGLEQSKRITSYEYEYEYEEYDNTIHPATCTFI